MPDVITIGGVDRSTDLHWDSLQIEQVAGEYTAVCSLKLNDTASAIAITEKDAITIVDTDPAPDETLFAGEVADVDWELLSLGLDGRRIVLRCQDHNILVEEAVIDTEESYSAQADSTIIDDLFTTYRADIDSVTHVATLDASMDFTVEHATLREALDEICKLTGGRWYVDEDKALHYFAAEANVAAWHLSDTPDLVNSFPYQAISRKSSGGTIVNQILVVGTDVSEWREDAASVALYGERPALVVDTSITDAATAQARGDAVLARYSEPRVTYNVTTRKAGLRAGMDVRLVCGAWAVDETLTVRRLALRWRGDERFYDLELGDVEFTALKAHRTFQERITQIERELPIPLAARGWGHDLTFSATDHNTVSWGAGDIRLAGAAGSYSINAGNTGNMAVLTYIYLDADVSTTDLQTTTSVANAIGLKKILVAVASPVADSDKLAEYQAFGGAGHGSYIFTDNIAANQVTANLVGTNQIITSDANIASAVITNAHITNTYADLIRANKLRFGDEGLFASDGVLLLGPGCELSATAWKALRGEEATIANAFQTMRGAFPNTQGIVMEPATTNLVTNPSIETNANTYNKYNATEAALTRSDTQARFGSYSLYCETSTNASVEGWYSDFISVSASTAYTLSMWLHTTSAIQIGILWYTAGDVYISSSLQGVTAALGWKRWQVTGTAPGTAAKARLVAIEQSGSATPISFYADGIQLEQKGMPTTTCIGDMAHCAWSGTAHASTSTRTGTTMQVPTANSISATKGSIVIWFRLNDDWNANGGILFDAGNANNEFWAYVDAAGPIYYFINGVARVVSNNVTPDIDHCAVFEWDQAADESALYLDGVEVNTGTLGGSGWTPGTNLGIGYSPNIGATYNLCGVITEFATFGDLLSPEEIAQLWNLKQPLVDHGATETPGIYIVDGKFRISSSYTGSRIEITPDEFAAYYQGSKIVEIDPDGISVLASTAYQDERSYQFRRSDGTVVSTLGGYYNTVGAVNAIRILADAITGYDSAAHVRAESPSGEDAQAVLTGYHGAGSYASVVADVSIGNVASIMAVINGTIRLNVDSSGVDATGDLDVSGDIECDQIATDGANTDGSAKWELGHALPGAPTLTHYVEIWINGTRWRMPAGQT
jgi:hypothetical protein